MTFNTARERERERERAIRTSAGEPDYDKKWGRYLPLQPFNVDQPPLPFARDTTKTYEQTEKRSKAFLYLKCLLSSHWRTTKACNNLPRKKKEIKCC